MIDALDRDAVAFEAPVRDDDRLAAGRRAREVDADEVWGQRRLSWPRRCVGSVCGGRDDSPSYA